jgi:hypothetical protein
MKHRMTDEPLNMVGNWSIHNRLLWENGSYARENMHREKSTLCRKGYTQNWLESVQLR